TLGWVYYYLVQKTVDILFDIAQYFQHTLCGLLFGINPVNQLPIFIVFNNNMFRRRNEAVFYSTIAADLILVSACVKKSYIKGLFSGINFRKKNFIDMFFRIVVVVTIAGDSS